VTDESSEWENLIVDCNAARLAISSQTDGELPVDPRAIAHHLETCGACRSYERRISGLNPPAVRAVSAPSSALAERVLGALEPDRSTSAESRFLRVALGVVGVLAFVQALPELLDPGPGLHAHTSRHLGVFTAALAVGFVYTALRPRRVGGLLPVAAVISLGLVVTGVIDVTSGRTPVAGEAAHVLEIVGLAIMWMLTRFERPRRESRRRSRTDLQPVPDDPLGAD
jgi:predicted anti-sigma-YlaC factor YlaD